jgi:hypothetical protein
MAVNHCSSIFAAVSGFGLLYYAFAKNLNLSFVLGTFKVALDLY